MIADEFRNTISHDFFPFLFAFLSIVTSDIFSTNLHTRIYLKFQPSFIFLADKK